MCCERSPSATAAMTRATSCVGRARSSMRELTAWFDIAQPPSKPRSAMRSVSRPSRRITLLTRSSSSACRCWTPASSSKRCANGAPRPARSPSRTEKSPSHNAVRASSKSLKRWSSTGAVSDTIVMMKPSKPASAGITHVWSTTGTVRQPFIGYPVLLAASIRQSPLGGYRRIPMRMPGTRLTDRHVPTSCGPGHSQSPRAGQHRRH